MPIRAHRYRTVMRVVRFQCGSPPFAHECRPRLPPVLTSSSVCTFRPQSARRRSRPRDVQIRPLDGSSPSAPGSTCWPVSSCDTWRIPGVGLAEPDEVIVETPADRLARLRVFAVVIGQHDVHWKDSIHRPAHTCDGYPVVPVSIITRSISQLEMLACGIDKHNLPSPRIGSIGCADGRTDDGERENEKGDEARHGHLLPAVRAKAKVMPRRPRAAHTDGHGLV